MTLHIEIAVDMKQQLTFVLKEGRLANLYAIYIYRLIFDTRICPLERSPQLLTCTLYM